jgi:hypothetical protein
MRSVLGTGSLAAALVVGAVAGVAAASAGPWPVAARSFQLVERASGPVNYYSVAPGPPEHVHSHYQPGFETAVVGYAASEAQARATKLSWRWRAITLPVGGDECRAGKGDSAAVVYVSWKRGLRYYTLKYVWSGAGTRGAVCDKKRNPFLAQDTVIVESGAPLGEWKSVRLDLQAEFRKHFENGDATAEVPDFFGIGLMSDGDQTRSVSSADFAEFKLE